MANTLSNRLDLEAHSALSMWSASVREDNAPASGQEGAWPGAAPSLCRQSVEQTCLSDYRLRSCGRTDPEK